MKITPTDVQSFLRTHTENTITDVIGVDQGEWSQAFFFQENSIAKVVRFGEHEEDFRKDQFAFCFDSPQLPIPCIEQIGPAFDGFFAISRLVQGTMIDDLDDKQMPKVIPAVMHLLAAFYSADTSDTTGFGPWDKKGNGHYESWQAFLLDIDDESANKRQAGWKAKLADRPLELEVFEQAYEKLTRLVDSCPEHRHVVHADLLHFNLLVRDDQIAAVIDWGCAKYGDFLYDLAWFVFWQFTYPAMTGINFPEQAKIFFSKKKNCDLTNFEQRLACYQLHIGLDSMAYCAFRENWQHVEMISNRLLEIMK